MRVFWRAECMGNFAHLHVHTSDGSLLDGMGKIKDVVKKAKEEGMPALAITDHGTGYGLVSFYDECKKNGIKPILGCEVYEAPESRFTKKAVQNTEEMDEIGYTGDFFDNRYFHLILLVKNEIGYKNLCILISRSNTEGFYYKPRIDLELLEEHHEGLVCLSACIAGRLPKAILSGNMDFAEKVLLRYKKMFGDDYYLEIQNHGIREEAIVAQEMVRLSRKHGIKLICTNDVHYVNSEDAEAHEWLLCLQTGKRLDEEHMTYSGDYSLKSEQDMRSLFPALPEAFDNTMEIVNKCNYDFVYGQYRMPKVVIPDGYGTDYFRYLQDLTWKGFEERYPDGHEYREQAKKDVEYELSVVHDMGFAEYFLDTRKTVIWAKDHDILVGPGRGSGAGSRMLYCLKITDIDPIRYGLLFERFLNPERVSMPDIDVDYCYTHKDEIIAAEAESNGYEKFAKIQTFVTLQAKGVLRDLARVAGLPVNVGNKLASLIPKDPKITLESAWKMNPELQEYIHSDSELEKLWEVAKKLEGTRKAPSTHACGVIPTPIPCEELFPVSVDSDSGYLVCQYDMEKAEHLGNLKKDLLMLRNLTIIDEAQQDIKRRYGITIPLWTDEILNDKESLEMIGRGDTNGVFQLESDGMKSFMQQLKPTCFEDIIAGVSLYRPGPMDFIPQYIKGKHEPESITYLVPQLEPILAPTYGCIVYQEQVMQIVRSLAGFSLGRADLVRKGMSKKKQEIMEEEEPHFIYGDKDLKIKGCIANGIKEEDAATIWSNMVDFAKYAFNKSHAAAYAAISMQTAYLKCHYPSEFTAGLLTSVMDKPDKLPVYISEFKKKGYTIERPDINTSEEAFTVIEKGVIGYGLASIKDVGASAIRSTIKEREENGSYKGLYDFMQRNIQNCNKRMVEALVHAGSFDYTGITRKASALAIDPINATIRDDMKKNIQGQLSLFDYAEDAHIDFGSQDMYIKDCPEYSPYEKIQLEKEATGSYLSGHPLDSFSNYLNRCEVLPSIKIWELQKISDKCYTFAGIIMRKKVVYTKRDGKPMAFLTLDDKEGSINVIAFPKEYVAYRDMLEEGLPVLIYGNVTEKDGERSLITKRVIDLTNIPRDIKIEFDGYTDYYRNQEKLNEFLRERPKPGDVYEMIRVHIKGNPTAQIFSTIVTNNLVERAVALFGSEHVKTVTSLIIAPRSSRW